MSLRRLHLATSWGELLVVGGSRAGEGTLILLPQLRLALDPGRPHRNLPAMSTVTISHGHMDHLAGLGYWAGQRALGSMGAAVVLAPRAIAADLATLLEVHARLEGGQPYAVEVVGVADGDVRPLRRDLELEFFATDHWVPTLGAQLHWTTHRLRPELDGLTSGEIAGRRAAGEAVTVARRLPLLAYCADSGAGLLRDRPEVLASEVVLLECSFFKIADRSRATTYGHLHLADLLDHIADLRCRHLVLLHASRRHRLREVEELLERELEPRLGGRLHHLVLDWD